MHTPRSTSALSPDLVTLSQQHLESGNIEAAEAVARTQLKRQPKDMAASYLLGLALSRMGQLDAAAFFLRGPAQMEPAQRDCQCEYGRVLFDIGKYQQGIEYLRRATQTDPTSAYAWEQLCRALLRAGMFVDAVNAGEQAVQLDSANTKAMTAIGTAWAALGASDEAARWYGKAVKATPHRIEAASAWAYFLNYIDAKPDDLAMAHKRCGAAANAAVVFDVAMPEREARNGGPLRIGFLSPDFRDHPVARFMLPLLRNIDREKFDVYLYHLHPTRDAVSRECGALAKTWRVVGHLPLPQLAQTIATDQLDVLVDLAGWTGNTGIAAMALRLAPLQASYLGYPSNTGIDEIDIRLVDAVTDPEVAGYRGNGGGTGPAINEAPRRLPGCFVCWAPPRNAPPVKQRTPDAPITFGSFNYIGKLSARCLKTWGRMLAGVPNSRLLIKGKGLDDARNAAVLSGILARNGIDHSRVQLRGTIASYTAHLAAYNDIDIALDPFPYNGTTTTCEALWMGVPVLTLAGTMHAGRVGASLLTAVGLGDAWVCETEDTYVAMATAFARDKAALALLRNSLRGRVAGSMLCDGAGFARRFERTVLEMKTALRA